MICPRCKMPTHFSIGTDECRGCGETITIERFHPKQESIDETYEQERDKAVFKMWTGVVNRLRTCTLAFKLGTNWAHARAEKMIALKNAHILDISGALEKSTIEIASRDTMIDKLEKALKWYEKHCSDDSAVADRTITELEEWKKQNEH